MDEVADHHDPVNRPAHYTVHVIESIDIVDMLASAYENVHPMAPFYIGVVLQYIYRAPFKNNCRQDLEKAIWYLQRFVDKLEILDARRDHKESE